MKNNSLSYLIISAILLCAGFYYRNESQKRIYKEDIITKEVTISKLKPELYAYESTDDIAFEFSEFPDKIFKIDHLQMDFDKGKELLTNLKPNDKVLIDVDRDHYQNKIDKGKFLGIKHSISLYGIRLSAHDEVPILDYNIEDAAKNLTISYLSFFGILIILILWGYEYIKRNRKLNNTQTKHE